MCLGKAVRLSACPCHLSTCENDRSKRERMSRGMRDIRRNGIEIMFDRLQDSCKAATRYGRCLKALSSDLSPLAIAVFRP